MDLTEDRRDSDSHCIFSRDLLCEKGHEAASGCQRDRGWDSDNAFGASADSSRFPFATAVQLKASVRSVFAGAL